MSSLKECSHHIWPNCAQHVALSILALLIWGIFYSIFQENVGYNSEAIQLVVLFIGAKVCGYLVSIFKCPEILGQMFFGMILRNVGYYNLSSNYQQLASILRQIALVNIMLPAGLNLDPALLKRWSILAVILAVLPAMVEVFLLSSLAHLFLNIPFIWTVLMGLILAAVSPSVIFPCLFKLENDGYGLEKGVNTLVVASSTINDIVTIAIFVAHLSVIFSQEPMKESINGPIGFLIGLIFGFIWGYICQYVPHKTNKYVISLRTLLIGIGSLFICFGSNFVGFNSAGVLGCIVSAFIAAQGWRKEGWIGNNNPVKINFMLLWKFFEPISFGLIGVEVDFSLLHGTKIIWMTLISLVALMGRVITAFVTGYMGDFTLYERIFFAISAIPKATVQATLGPLPLEKAQNDEELTYALDVLVLSVISIIITAPIGAWLILTFGPKLLPRTINDDYLYTEDVNIRQPLLGQRDSTTKNTTYMM